MNIVFTDSFFKSFKRMINRERLHWKFWDFIRYDLPNFFKNIWKFRKELYRHRSWDSAYSMQMLKRSLEVLADNIEVYGNEIDGPRLKKVEAMRRAIEILTNVIDDRYIDMAEEYLGKEVDCSDMFSETESPEIRQSNSEIFDLAAKLEADEWIELFKILQGQDHTEYVKLYNAASQEETAKRDLWYDWYDGSGMKHWWN